MAIDSDYSERIRLACKTSSNPTNSPITIRQLAQLCGYSYESVRRVYKGDAIGSEVMNEALCRALGLPEDEMWALAEFEKTNMKRDASLLTATAGSGGEIARLSQMPWLTVAQCAAYLNKSEQAVRGMLKRGVIPRKKLGGSVYIDRAALDEQIRMSGTGYVGRRRRGK